MVPLSKSTVPRRAVLAWTAGIVTVGVSAATTPRASAATGITVLPTGGGERRILRPGPGPATTLPVDLGAIVAAAGGAGAGTVITFTFDPALYDLLPKPVVRGVSGPLTADLAVGAVDRATARQTANVTLGTPMPAGAEVVIIVGHLRPRDYPSDIMRDVRPGDVQAVDRRRAQRGQRALGSSTGAGPGTPWGAEAGVLWEPRTWDQGHYRYYCPRSASLTSTGPGAVPAGYRLRVSLDARVVSEIRVTSAVLGDGRRPVGSVKRLGGAGSLALEWTGAQPLAAGDNVRLALTTVGRALRGPLSGVVNPVITFLPPGNGSAEQRTTYLETVTRSDHVVDEEGRRYWQVWE